jgi:hypothetical protein
MTSTHSPGVHRFAVFVGPYQKYVITLWMPLLYMLYFSWRRRHRGADRGRLSFASLNLFVVVMSFTLVNLYLSQSHGYF